MEDVKDSIYKSNLNKCKFSWDKSWKECCKNTKVKTSVPTVVLGN